jgi:hypothetical protein
MSTPNTDQPADADQQDARPTVASLATVASTTDDLESESPTHPDRPVGVNVDTAAAGTEPGDTETLDEAKEHLAQADGLGGDSEALGGEQTDAADSRDA